jgi:hypothetical protein
MRIKEGREEMEGSEMEGSAEHDAALTLFFDYAR